MQSNWLNRLLAFFQDFGRTMVSGGPFQSSIPDHWPLHWRSQSCEDEICALCGDDAMAKVEEVVFSDDPLCRRHPLTAYLCEAHFRKLMGARGVDMVQRARASLRNTL